MGKTKKCTKCDIEKPFDAFQRAPKMRDGRCSWCRACKNVARCDWAVRNPEKQSAIRRNQRIRNPQKVVLHDRKMNLKQYGITLEEYEALLEKQGGVCAICEKVCSSGRNLAVDHAHTVGIVRGLLCMKCNRSLGGFDDDPGLLLRGVAYLENRNQTHEEYRKWDAA